MHSENRVRDSFTLTRDLSARAERLASRTGRSRSSVYRAAVKEYLDRHEQAAITAAINEALGREAQDRSFVEGARRALDEAELVDEWSE
jgi:predicted transcriptional regulator